MLWIPITLAAAALQNARSAAQKRLAAQAGAAAATYARFCFALPFALLFWALAAAIEGAVATPTTAWLVAAAVGALAQILATYALIASFAHGRFTLGTGASKTEPALAAAAGALWLGEVLTPLAGLGVGVGVAGVTFAAASAKARPPADGGDARAAVALGLAAGAAFAVSAVAYRAASLRLGDGSAALRASQTLALALGLQTLAMGGWLALRAPAALAALGRGRRAGLSVGAFGALASLGWFTAMTLEPAAHVRALAQVELVFAVLTSAYVLRERPGRAEILGCLLVGVGSALLLIGA